MEPMKPMAPMRPMSPMCGGERWWPEHLGQPSASGSQNGMRYAFFPGPRRLLIEQDGKRSIYDSGNHRVGGIAQQDSGTRSVTFTSQTGTVDLDQLSQLSEA